MLFNGGRVAHLTWRLERNSQVLDDCHQVLKGRIARNQSLFLGLIHQFQQQVIEILCVRIVLLGYQVHADSDITSD